MDEEDSQEELINKNASHGKGKRPATSILSDEEENSEDGEDSQEGASDSEEEEDDASVEGEDGEEEDEADSELDENAEKELEGAVGSTTTDLAGLSSDEDAEKCPICLNSFHEQPVATPESCAHYFCLDCILEWAKNANSCPVDRRVFSNILLRKCFGGKVQKTITVQKTAKPGQEEQVDLDLEQTSCEVCGGSDREDRLLLCDGCDAGYHMECLTPPLDAVPVEEWFCPECAANNRSTRIVRSSEDENSILPTTSRSRPANSRPTRAIARTQHSERVRANVNRHRITQARTAAQLWLKSLMQCIAPRYMMQSTWLDETINAVVAGLNTAVYVRDLTPRPRPRRRRRTVKRKSKKEGKAVGGKTASTGVKRRKRRRRTKSRKKLVAKKTTTTRGRIARSLGIKKAGRSSTIPSVYRPSEQTLGSMRADIGAASLSIYGDPFDLDPFDDENEETQQAPTPSSLLEAKRRGLSRSALRSHQPVARPISAGFPSRRGPSVPQVQEVVEAAPVPDLLGSILSGQSMLLMDSSDVVINRDGSLKATKPAGITSNSRPSSSSAISFRINASGNPWHARRLSAPDPAMPVKDESKKKAKQILLTSLSQAKKAPVKSEVYDPFNPTGSDSSESEAENDFPGMDPQSNVPMEPAVEQNEGPTHQIKTEPMELNSPTAEESSEIYVQVKKEPASFKDDPWPLPSNQLATGQSGSLAAVMAYSGSPAMSDAESTGTPERPFNKALDRSKSSSTSTHHSDNKVKIEVKAEPEDEPSPVQPKSKSEPIAPKGNGLCDEVPSVASSSNASHKNKEQEIISSCPQPEEEVQKKEGVQALDLQAAGVLARDRKKETVLAQDRKKETVLAQDQRKKGVPARHLEKKGSLARNLKKESGLAHALKKKDDLAQDPKKEGDLAQDLESEGTHIHKTGGARHAPAVMRAQERGNQSEISVNSMTVEGEMDTRGQKRKSAHALDLDQGPERGGENRCPHIAQQQEMEVRQGQKGKDLDQAPENEDGEQIYQRALAKKKGAPTNLQETDSSYPECSDLIEESSNPEEITKETPLVNVSNKPYEIKPKEIKQEPIWPLDEVREPQLQIDIKEEKKESFDLCEEIKKPEEIKKEIVTTTSVTEKSQELGEVGFSDTSTPINQTSTSLPQDGKSTNDSSESPKQIKIEPIWPDDDDEDDEDDPYSDTALVINLCPSTPMDCKKETDAVSTALSVVAKEEMEVEPFQTPCVVKQEPVDSSDEDINVDFLIDNLDFIKKEMKDGSVTAPAGDTVPQPVTQEVTTGSKQEIESALVVAGTKSKSQGKRVTWNIQEPEGPQPEKMSKLALFKLKLKQEGSRKAASSSFTQSSSLESATVHMGAKPTTSLNTPLQEGLSNSDQGGSKSHKEELLQDLQQKDKYMKKLHMQERAIEEVKLAIKPFYQKRDITKEEYKEILRKAVQKVCHSKSGEINPVKVANLVKAYVDKYKHARKHHKTGSSGQNQSAEGPKDSETSG
ncbi:hypothetical protein NFI96_017710 [Prochilodus magdalenae]|nr:hypothetical protein NFI96_017710 [Prochilodus magdalenae]